jgi:hypothetical protein
MPTKEGLKRKSNKIKASEDVSSVRTTSKVVAIVCSDLHLSQLPPVARSAEPDWYAAMARPLRELRELQKKYRAPVLIAGDIFDQWNSPAELINFAIKNLPKECYAIPGQHDLPHHNYEELNRSAYGTLVEAGVIKNLTSNISVLLSPRVWVTGFPWGTSLAACTNPYDGLKIALIHKYCWMPGSSYENAPPENHAYALNSLLAGYDLKVYGDNHKGFQRGSTFNCGGFMRRKTDEALYEPMVGLVYASGKIIPHRLDQSKTLLLTKAKEEKELDIPNLNQFIEELSNLSHDAIDFVEACKNFCVRHKVGERTQQFIQEAMEANKQ